MIQTTNVVFSTFTSLVSSAFFNSALAAGPGGGIPWWIWVLIVILFLLVALWWWMRRPSQEVSPLAQAESTNLAQIPEQAAAPVVPARAAEQPAPPAAPSVAETPPPAAPPVPPTPDNLTRIEGIGPKISRVLNSSGITTFTQLAGTEASRVRQILASAGIKSADPSTWGEQAKLAAAGDWGALQAMQDQLKAGRRQ